MFLGILAANWNIERVGRQETGRLLSQLDTELMEVLADCDSMDDYYAVSGRYATRALAGWRGDPAVSDSDFVIAAYQASQINGVGTNSAVWAEIFGADNLRNVDDVALRQNLRRVMTFDYDLGRSQRRDVALSRGSSKSHSRRPATRNPGALRRHIDPQRKSGAAGDMQSQLARDRGGANSGGASRTPRPDPRTQLAPGGIATQLQNVDTLRTFSTALSKSIE